MMIDQKRHLPSIYHRDQLETSIFKDEEGANHTIKRSEAVETSWDV
jgi:hypothetical protein